MNSDFASVKKVLVIKLREIGDVLLTVPVFRALRENFPHSYIAGLVYSGTEQTLTGNPLVDEVIVYDKSTKKKGPGGRLLEELRFLRKIRSMNFDMVLDLTSGDRPAIISFVSGAPFRVAFRPGKKGLAGKKHLYTHLVINRGDRHTVIKNLELVRHLGIDTNDLSVDLHLNEKERLFVREVFRKKEFSQKSVIVHVHPLSRLFHKCWRDEHMAKIIEWLLDKDLKVVVTSGPDKREIDKNRKILSMVDIGSHGHNLLDLSGKTTIKELAALSEASSLFFGVDSAPMHIAAALKIPVVALFGDGETRWAPWGEGHCVISHSSGQREPGVTKKEFIQRNMEKIRPDEVISVLHDAIKGLTVDT